MTFKNVCVYDLSTGELLAEFMNVSLRHAAIYCYAKNLNDSAVDLYEKRYGEKVVEGLRSAACGTFCAMAKKGTRKAA